MKLGEHEVLGELGRGGMGVVYRARTAAGQEVAIKLLRRANATPEALARFERERRLLAALGDKEGFVPLLGAGEAPEGPFFVMPLLGGGTLRDRLLVGRLPLDEARALGVALGQALGRAHAAGIVHRDVKPENVLFDGRGRPLIADLGLARHFLSDAQGSQSVQVTFASGLRGTVGYMAPEQLRGPHEVGPPADVFALGATIYECLAGQPAFMGSTLPELLARCLDAAPQSLLLLRPEASVDVVECIHRALDRSPQARHGDGSAFAAALEKTRPAAVTATQVAPSPDRRLPATIGRYAVRELLGHGSAAAVYAAHDPQLGRDVAIKLLVGTDDPSDRERFLREARLASRLKYPGIVPVHDVGEDRGRPFIVMELVKGRTLRQAMQEGLDLRQGVAALRCLAEGLAWAHEEGVVHRDVKPENAMLRPDGRALLMDFGIASDPNASQRLTRTGTLIGTAAYMAPEQVRGQAGSAADVWALGAMLYELLCGRPPFQGSAVAILRRLGTEAVEPPSKHARDVDPGLEALAMACLAKDPTARPEAEWVARRLIVAPPREPGRAGLVVGAIVAAVLLLAAGAFVLVRTSSHTPPVVPDAAPPPPPPPPPPPVVPEPEPAPALPPLVWEGLKSMPSPGLEIQLFETIERGKHASLQTCGRSTLIARFTAPDPPPATTLRLVHLATDHEGKQAAWVNITLNGQPVASRHEPKESKEGEALDVSPWVRAGENELEIVLHVDSRTAYWIRGLQVSFGEPPR